MALSPLRWLLPSLLALGCARPPAASSPAVRPPAASLSPATAPLDANFEVRGGTSLHLVCRGAGRPPVVLEAGLGNDSSIWSKVEPDLARTTRVCAYDRAGLGKSGPAPRPHSSELMAEELHDLLRAANVSAPYVLVGHSLGGANIRYFTARHPREVVGMVFVDAATEQQPSRYWSLLPASMIAEFKTGLASMPEGLDYDTFVSSLEGLHTASPSLGNLPLVVLSRSRPAPGPPELSAEKVQQLEAAWRLMQAELPRLSTNSAHAFVKDASHHIQLDRPDVTIAAVNEVVAAVREGRRVRQCCAIDAAQ